MGCEDFGKFFGGGAGGGHFGSSPLICIVILPIHKYCLHIKFSEHFSRICQHFWGAHLKHKVMGRRRYKQGRLGVTKKIGAHNAGQLHI